GKCIETFVSFCFSIYRKIQLLLRVWQGVQVESIEPSKERKHHTQRPCWDKLAPAASAKYFV
ncbi:MAG: hypothetical protein ABF317_02300, partial [Bacteroidia bacterium]